jgi:CheY-like chemotaxis protein
MFVRADATQIAQALANLVANASDSLRDGAGAIDVSFRRVTPNDAIVRQNALSDLTESDTYVVLTVQDDGIGMPPEVASRILDPFFTTKSPGRGLGLAATVGIVRRHGGGLAIESEVGRGSAFSLLLPEASSDEHALVDPSATRSSAPRVDSSVGAILVVDDEEAVRKVTSKILMKAGYDVVTAEHGEQALERLGQLGQGYRAIILDVTMPRLDGRQTLRELRRRGISLPVIMVSGFAEEQAPTSEGRAETTFLAKPFRAQALLDHLSQVLDR